MCLGLFSCNLTASTEDGIDPYAQVSEENLDMSKLKVKNFSCIKDCEIDISKFTILVGPQASGKSVLSKLLYFCNSVTGETYQHIEDKKSASEFRTYLGEKFCRWFPHSAWGDGDFSVQFESGQLTISIRKIQSKRDKSNSVVVEISSGFIDAYTGAVKKYSSLVEERLKKRKDHTDDDFSMSFHFMWSAYKDFERTVTKLMGKDYIERHFFIPAGRSFFTSIGRAIEAFSHGDALDPLTIQFGRYFARIRETRYRGRQFGRMDKQGFSKYKEMTEKLFNGEIKSERDKEFVQSNDGRVIPFTFLSSGQQELLPLWMVLNSFVESKNDSSKKLVYIEEPEAHLFPSTQSEIIMYIAQLTKSVDKNLCVFITTHSPYILSTLNNLIKAGRITFRKSQAIKDRVGKVVEEAYWLAPRSVSAYAIQDGLVRSIIEPDGLIDAEYLDYISGPIAETFSKLLEVEYSP